ncbi:MAG: hypothetical protein IJE91_00455 [Clostridia bacterium]|nr:hypothetical protein [Clostridia bacterium]
MKKLSWTKVLNISIIIAALLVLGCFFGTAFYKRPVNETQAEALVEGIPFKVGVVNRNASAFVNENFTYTTTEEFYNGTLETITANQHVMLYNYGAEKNFISNASSLQQVKNLYISFGAFNEELYLTYLEVYVRLNGNLLTSDHGINQKIEYYDASDKLPGTNSPAYYWFDYFDAKPLTSDKTQSAEGLYEFQFDYMYVKDGKISQKNTYTFKFYLLDQSKYNNYPQFENATEGNLDATNVKQYYYNYTNANLTKLNIDAARFNVSYTREKNKDTESVTSSFAVDPNTKLGTLTLTKTTNYGGNSVETISNIVGNANGEYFTSIYFDDLGSYSFTIKYLLKLSDGLTNKYEVIENILAYDANEPKYEQNLIAKGQYKLHIFGVKLYFSKNGSTELKQKENNQVLVQADVTNQLCGINNSYDYITHGFKNADTFTIPGVDGADPTEVTNPLKTFTNYPVTNLAPLYFDYYSTFTYSGSQPLSTYKIYKDSTFSEVKQSGYITKDTNLDETGYYEVIINYSFERYSHPTLTQVQGAEYVHKQAFIFQIDNSTPEITMYKSTEQTPDNIIKNNSFINSGVTASWQDGNYFQAPITAEYFQYNFDGGLISSSAYTKGSVIGNGGNGKYLIRLYYSTTRDVYVETSFTVDTTPISDILIQPIYQRKDGNGNATGYGLVTDTNEVNFNGSTIINQPFTLTYSQKDSGAAITTTYYKIPFAYNENVGNSISFLSDIYVETDYIIDPTNMSSGVDYSLDYSSIASGIISTENAFVEDKSYIYLFEISDEAGNTATKYIIYDLTKPYVIIDSDAETEGVQEIDNPYNIVNKKATLTWGNYKSIKVDAVIENESIQNKKLEHIILNEPSLFKRIDPSKYYLCVPITRFTANQDANNITLEGSTFQSGVTLYPTTNGLTSQVDLFFAGDGKVYTYTITDASHLRSATNIAKSNISGSYVEMNLDNAQGMAYGVFGQITDNNVGSYLKNKTTSAKQLRFTYFPGEEGSDYYVKSVTYSFYDFAPESYETVNTILTGETNYLTEYNTNIENGIPYPTYPFSKTATILNRAVTLSDDKVSEAGQTDRVVSNILNPVSGEGSQTYSKEGMYVIRREYEASGNEEAYEYDSVVRYYVFYVDRNGIIEIDTNIEDTHIYQSSRSEMLYETGSGIIFNFSKVNQMGQYDTYYTALQIQQYLAYAGSTIFDSNKLPVNFYLPLDKYNSRVTISKATDGTTDFTYLSTISSDNSFNFQLRYNILHTLNGKDTVVFNNTGLEEVINYNYVTLSNNDGYRTLKFVKEGQYTVKLYDRSDNRGDLLSGEINASIENQYNNSYEFSFVLSHESPTGEYLTKYNDANRTDQLLTITSTTSENLKFNSLNNDSLRFRFRKNDDKYRAEVNPDAIIVNKTVGNSTSTIFSGGQDSNILKFVPDGIDSSSGLPTTTGYYVLTIFDEQDYQNDGKTYLGGTGQTRDYLQSKSQNITYTITLQYIGDEGDYLITLEDGSQVNYFTRTFTITLDRIKPQYNYQSLITLDNQKFAASSSLDSSRMDNYFFAVNNNFKFIQNQTLGGPLDSTALFVRKLVGKNADCDFPEYYKTFTPDDENYYAEGNTNHLRFSESNASFEQVSYGGLTGEPIDANIAFRQGRGYYEVVERDEAGNYQVYAIYYNPDPINDRNIITYCYNPALVEGTDSIQAEIPFESNDTIQNSIELLGDSLEFIAIDYLGNAKNDYFYKCIIESSALGTPKTITNNPNDRNDSNNWTSFLNLINETLEFTKANTPSGFRVTITFVNRLSENYVITYRVPGEPLKLLPPTSESGTQFTVTIPADTDSTYIKEFHAWKFTDGAWIEQSQDSLGNTIVKSYSTGASLQGRSYTFGLGEFKFKLIDIFGRESVEYKGLGVNDVNLVLFNGNSVVYDSDVPNYDGTTGANVTHTANNVTVQYQTNLYSFVVKERTEDGSYVKVEMNNYHNVGITEQSVVDGVRTLIFQNNAKDTIKQFQVTLTVDKLAGTEGYTPTQYNFAINKTLPEIILRNLSGGSLITSKNSLEPTIHTENFTVNWENTDAYSGNVNLIRTYIDASGKQVTETINNIPNGYEVGLSGTYTASISSSLGYSDSAYNIYFKLVSGEIVVYDVVAINNGVETILRPSPKTSTITIDDVEKVLYRYYAQASFNNPQGSEKYIELRANKNKGIEYTLISDSTPDEEPEAQTEGEEEGSDGGESAGTNTLIKKTYKIYGSSNYGYERYIEIIFVNELTNEGLGFTNIKATYPTDNQGNISEITLNGGIVTTNVSQLDLTWKAYNLGAYNYTELRGNLIYLDYYFNDNFVRTIYSDSAEFNKLTIKTAGIHKFKLYDLAGNIQYFGANSELVINLVNNVLFTINNAEPINNQIFNSDVVLEITNRYLYFSDPTISATLNGAPITPERVGTSFYAYKFNQHGYYEVIISTYITQNESVTTKYCFTIINQRIALPCFSVPQNANFKVVSILKQNSDITHTLTNLKELWISPATVGVGNYTITLSQFNDALNQDVEFSFQVWVNNEIPYIYSSQEFGTSTTKDITITYNPKIIYDQVGESYIAITGKPVIHINSESPNAISTVLLTENLEYWIQIYSADNKLINSYKVTKDEPLNTTAIIIIVVVSVVVVALIVVFIVIRRHLKFR